MKITVCGAAGRMGQAILLCEMEETNKVILEKTLKDFGLL